MNVARHVERGRAAHPDRVAVRFAGRSITYAGLDRQASAAASDLAARGVGAGDRVALYLPNCPEFIVGYLAALKTGGIAVSLNSFWKREEVRRALRDCDARVVLTNEALEPNVATDDLPDPPLVLRVETLTSIDGAGGAPVAAVDCADQTPAAIVYSSGTAGEPRGCTLSHGNVLSNVRAKVDYLGIRPDDRLLLFVPLFHCFGQNAILNAAFEAGATVVLERHFSVDGLVRILETEAPTMLFGPPTVFSILLERLRREHLASVRYFFSAAAPMPPAVALRWQDTFGRVIHEGYGLTETSPFATYNHRTAYRLGSVGTPIDNVAVKIVDPDTGIDSSPDEVGEILIRGPNVMLGYWRRPDETARMIRSGWLHTGDLGRRDGDGYLYVVDRLKDVIIVGGLKVYPAEVERVLCEHADVSAAAVYGAPDAIFGERVVASVVLMPGRSATAAECIGLCASRIAAYKVPSDIRFADSLPVSPTGKILRRFLRREW